MILCIDIGNSRLKWGLHDGTRWQQQAVLDHAAVGELATHVPTPPSRIIACNVADEVMTKAIDELALQLAAPLVWFASSASACGVSNAYAKPTQLGADRWAALIGARALHSGAAVVVMAGTATTIDQLDANGCFRGGLILPGLALMRSSLARDTARLPYAKGIYREVPDNTDDAIVSGSLHATLGAIERMRDSMSDNAIVILSGGAATELSSLIAAPVRTVDNLVLEGLLQAAATT